MGEPFLHKSINFPNLDFNTGRYIEKRVLYRRCDLVILSSLVKIYFYVEVEL